MLTKLACLFAASALASSSARAATPGTVRLTCDDALHERSPGSNRAVALTIPNDSSSRLELLWMDFHGHPVSYGFIEPHRLHRLETFVGHVWLLQDAHGRCVDAFAAAEPKPQSEPAGYRTIEEGGITYLAPGTVSDAALKRAQYVVDHMLENLGLVRESMKKAGFKVEIISRSQVLSDLPDYAAYKGHRTRDGRDFDTGTRGLGGEDMCSIGEENLLCLPRQPYRDEDILVHEFSHSIKFHLTREQSSAIDAAFANARSQSLYPSGAYMIRDAQEYWAEGTQVWFGATKRSDVNGGFNSREALRAHDPKLFALLRAIYGEARVEKAPGCGY